MNPEDSYKYIKSKINDSMDLEDAINAFIDFYSLNEIDFCSKENEDDLLLFQFGGPYSWSPYLNINLTRQYTFYEKKEFCKMTQLRMDISYLPDGGKIEAGNFWLEKLSVEEFKEKVLSSNVIQLVRGKKIFKIDLKYGDI